MKLVKIKTLKDKSLTCENKTNKTKLCIILNVFVYKIISGERKFIMRKMWMPTLS